MSDNRQDSLNELEHDQDQHDQAEHGAIAGTPAAEAYEHQSVSSEQHELRSSGLRDSVLRGDAADDRLHGGQRNDVLDGDDGNDTLDGGDGDDVLIAGGHTDRGANSLDGGAGDDVLVAGGAETRELHDYLQSHQEVSDAIRADGKFAGLLSLLDAASSATETLATSATPAAATNTFAFHDGNGHDAVYNFHALGDRIQIDRGVNGTDITDIESLAHHITVSGDDLTIDLGQGNSVTLVGVDVAHLSAENVLWA